VVGSTVEDSAVAVSTAVAFVATVLVIADSLMMSSSAASAFRVGGAGATRTAIIRTVTMDTADTVTMGGPVTDIAMGADEGISGVRKVGDMPGYGSLASGLCACTSIRRRTTPRSSMQFRIVSAPSFFVGSALLTS
jgi:hypothetical protein